MSRLPVSLVSSLSSHASTTCQKCVGPSLLSFLSNPRICFVSFRWFFFGYWCAVSIFDLLPRNYFSPSCLSLSLSVTSSWLFSLSFVAMSINCPIQRSVRLFTYHPVPLPNSLPAAVRALALAGRGKEAREGVRHCCLCLSRFSLGSFTFFCYLGAIWVLFGCYCVLRWGWDWRCPSRNCLFR